MKERSLEIENLKKICDLKNAQIVEVIPQFFLIRGFTSRSLEEIF